MTDYEYLFAITLQQKLKRKIRGNIYVCFESFTDRLNVKITNIDDSVFRYSLQGFTEEFHYGITTDQVVRNVMRDYKAFLIEQIENRYFYND